ncbi:hypothetical protein [Bradyrhizobium sp. CCBAU 051011]|uniref:hypothetical protein n=1 Tax=Bradyrhizobium sp. CCBAU 051011 TaxID=858422 RepID=UPI00192A385D|nr:hypothetical protein [Bradyrhizobium sp. CCBAU 051011]
MYFAEGDLRRKLFDATAAASELVMQTGRPLIVVPSAVQWLDLSSVLVAWKDVREARRAVVDALPILAVAKEVAIAEFPEQGASRRCREPSPMHDARIHLCRSGGEADPGIATDGGSPDEMPDSEQRLVGIITRRYHVGVDRQRTRVRRCRVWMRGVGAHWPNRFSPTRRTGS